MGIGKMAGEAAIEVMKNENVQNKTASVIGMLFPYAGVTKKAVDMYIDEIEKDAEKYVYNTTAETVKKCLDDLNCDVFGFGRRMWILYPSYFENKDESQKKTFDSNSVDIRVDVRIRRVGQGSI